MRTFEPFAFDAFIPYVPIKLEVVRSVSVKLVLFIWNTDQRSVGKLFYIIGLV